jgi:hypothetical protein
MEDVLYLPMFVSYEFSATFTDSTQQVRQTTGDDEATPVTILTKLCVIFCRNIYVSKGGDCWKEL